MNLGEQIKATVERLGYKWFSNPGETNIVYVEGVDPDGSRNGNRPNAFDSVRYLLSHDGTILGAWPATTHAGAYYEHHLLNPGGAFHIALGQQTAWIMGNYHHGNYEALLQEAPLYGTRDSAEDFQRAGPTVHELVGAHHHWGYDYPRDNVSNSAAGCQVGETRSGHLEFIRLLKQDPRYQADHNFMWTSTVLTADQVLGDTMPVVTQADNKMKTAKAGRDLIESFEGLILGAYDDANDRVVQPGDGVRGTLTIGYGHTDAAGPPKVYAGQVITKEEADSILAVDLAAVENDVNRMVKVPINQNQFDALVSFHFNTGGLGRSSVLSKLNEHDFQGAADAFLLWNRAQGQVLNGLVRRRKAERALFLAPYQTTQEPIKPTSEPPKGSETPSKDKGSVVTGGAVIAGTAATTIAVVQQGWTWWEIGLGAIAVVVLLEAGFQVYKYIKRHQPNVTNT